MHEHIHNGFGKDGWIGTGVDPGEKDVGRASAHEPYFFHISCGHYHFPARGNLTFFKNPQFAAI